MNQAILSGHLTANVEVREVGEHHISRFTLACNEGDRVVFLPIECWNMRHLVDYLSKGSRVLVSGSLKQDDWMTDSGEKRSRILLTAYKVEFLTLRADAGELKSSRRMLSRQGPNSRVRGPQARTKV